MDASVQPVISLLAYLRSPISNQMIKIKFDKNMMKLQRETLIHYMSQVEITDSLMVQTLDHES